MFHYISYEDRKIIESMLKQGESIAKIAETIGNHRASIYKELKRCPKGHYTAEEAQKTLHR